MSVQVTKHKTAKDLLETGQVTCGGRVQKIKVRTLPDWPPKPGGTLGRGKRFPTSGEAVVYDVFPLNGTTVTFRAKLEDHPHSYDFKASSEQIANQIHNVVAANIGKTVAELGEFEIEV